MRGLINGTISKWLEQEQPQNFHDKELPMNSFETIVLMSYD